MRTAGECLPPLNGRLFVVTVRLRGDLPAAVRAATGCAFLGGVLHGAVRSRWFDLLSKTPQLAWRVLIPPTAAPDSPGPGLHSYSPRHFQFGVLLHGGSEVHWQQAQRALESLTGLGAGAVCVPVLSAHCTHRAVHGAELPALPTNGGPHQAGPRGWGRLLLHWCTPLHLASRAKIEAGHGDAPPSALAVVRSLRRRVAAQEPAWAQALGLFDSHWVGVEEALREPSLPLNAGARNRTHAVTWRYGSRTKLAPFARTGLLGTQVFYVPASAALLGLLSVGAWLGAGESTSFGCGHFRWRMRLADGQLALPLTTQPWAGVNGGLLD